MNMIDIEKLSNLPKFIGYGKHSEFEDRGGWRHGTLRINGQTPWEIEKRILIEFLGKDVNLALSKFHYKIPKHHHHYRRNDSFWGNFNILRYGWNGYRTWYLDKDSKIRNNELENPPYKGPYKIYSEGFKSDILHKVTGHPQSHFNYSFEWVYNKEEDRRKREKVWTYEGPKEGKYRFLRKKLLEPQVYKALNFDFEVATLEGWVINCASKNDPRFQRHMSEKRKDKRRSHKLWKQSARKKQYSFLTTSEKLQKEQRETDLIKRDSHGFDENSFKGEFYHGRKGKQESL